MLPPDYHIHTHLCRHAIGQPHQYAAQALRHGLEEIGFSDHAPTSRNGFDDWRMRQEELDLYIANIQRLQQEYPSLVILLALEVDYLPGEEEWIQTLARRYPWDYLIGSVHYIDDSWDIDNPEKKSAGRQLTSATSGNATSNVSPKPLKPASLISLVT